MARKQNNNSTLSGNTRGKSSKSGSGRGFASMDPEARRLIAAEGGRAAHAKGTAHQFSSEEAREAGRKGGAARGNALRNNSGSGSMMQWNFEENR